LRKLLPEFEFCVVDLETTGLYPENGSGIIEVGGVKIIDGKIADTFEKLANPGHAIPEEISEITGLTNDDIKDAESTSIVLDEFFDFIGDSIYIAHNARFDLSFLRSYRSEPLQPFYIDTLRMARQLLSTEKHSLDHLADRLNLSLNNHHRAGDDARATAELFLQLTDQISSPEDYFRCKLPKPILEKAPVRVPEPDFGLFEGDPIPDVPPTEWILFGLYELDTTLGVNKLAKILSGSESQAVSEYDSLDSYGKLSSYTQQDIKDAIEKALEEGFVAQSGEQYPVLNLTDKGINRLRNTATV
jgi:DNA polymerase III epsilon subunit family exonuclease